MSDLIERKAAIEALHTRFRDGFEEDKWWNSTHVLAALEDVPSAQTDRKKGKWTIDRDCEGKSRYVTCNICRHREFNWYNPNFCPNCGADMRGEKDEY